jgi:topoisomerase-4 subunit A
LKKELQIERDRLLEKIFYKSLERIFIEKRLYKKIETVKSLEGIHEVLESSLKPFTKKLLRTPTFEDRERLLQIPIRRISQFDINKNQDEIALLEKTHQEIEKNLKNVKKFAINHLKNLSEKYGQDFPRKTRIKAIEELDRRAIETKEIKVGYDPDSGYIGTKVSAQFQYNCTNFDKLLVLFKDGRYKVMNIPEKQYFDDVAWAGIADKKTIINVIYKNLKTEHVWAKRFIVDKFILDKAYSYLDENCKLLDISAKPDQKIEWQFSTKSAQKDKKNTFNLNEIDVKGAQTKGVCLIKEKVKKVIMIN